MKTITLKTFPYAARLKEGKLLIKKLGRAHWVEMTLENVAKEIPEIFDQINSFIQEVA